VDLRVQGRWCARFDRGNFGAPREFLSKPGWDTFPTWELLLPKEMFHSSAMRAACIALLVLIGGLARLPAQTPIQTPVQPLVTPATELPEPEKLFKAGKYEEALKATRASADATATVPPFAGTEDAEVLKIRALLALGRYGEAKTAWDQGLQNFPNSLRLRVAGIEVLRMNNEPEKVSALRSEIDQVAGSRPWAYRAPLDRVALAWAALELNVDPRRVLENVLDPLKKENPDFRDAYLASGELALQKNDFALAAKAFGQAARKFPDDADAHFGLARAYDPSDSRATSAALEKTLTLNPNHTGAHLMLADAAIDGEAYDEAEKVIAKALAVNPNLPEAHAYRAVIAHLRADEKTEREAKAQALKPWATNAAVPHLIGRKLSRKYRFAEGSALQREALKYNAEYTPARIQLAQDLLRLGFNEEGWALAEEVHKSDPYDVVAYNLTNLRDAMAKFRTLKSEHFDIRMDPKEAEIYGAEVIALLEKAHAALTKKYGITLKERTVVEIFPDQKDFAIRTFGLPGGAGYLGVCFGRVITANSPAARPGATSNWQAMLWHEFGHVVTLTLTRNKMPRWLSEGISVYEERQQRGSWGEQMQPRYRAMLLAEDLTPVSKLSGAFLRPKTAAHLQFAYYQASLVVEWFVQKWGLPKVRECLAELGRGVEINAALAKHFLPIEQLDTEFREYARAKAKATGPKLDWTAPSPAELRSPTRLSEWIAKNPDNYTALSQEADRLVEEGKWEEAKKPLRRLIELYPNQHAADSAYAQLARVHRQLDERSEEEQMLKKVAELSAEAADVYERLMAINAERKDWKAVLGYAEQYAAVNPLLPAPHRYAAEASEALGNGKAAISSYRALLQLNPPNPAQTHFRLGKLLHATGDKEAKRHVLLALEEAPRFRAALELLLEMNPEPLRARGVLTEPKP
jgi:tetratricopeptide (TPR) repeat protein